MATTPISDAPLVLTTSNISRVVLMTADEWALIKPRLTPEVIRWDSLLVLKILLPTESADLVIQPNSLCNYYLGLLASVVVEQLGIEQQERLIR